MKRSHVVSTLLLTTSVAAFVSACAPEEQKFTSVAECERAYGKGQCNAAEPVLMTEANRPSHSSKEECERIYGKGNCESKSSHSSGATPLFMWYPLLFPGRTYYYPPGSGMSGYYNGDPKATPLRSPSGGRPVTATPRPGVRPIATPRNGFGGTGRGIGGGG